MGDEEQLDLDKIGEGEEGAAGEGEGEKRGFLSDRVLKILWFILGGIFVVGITVTVAMYVAENVVTTTMVSAAEEELIDVPEPPLASIILEEFKVNLAGEEKHFCRTILAIGYPRDVSDLAEEINARTQEFRHIIFMELAGKRIDELDSREEKLVFLEEVRNKLNKRLLHPIKIRQLFIHEMVLM